MRTIPTPKTRGFVDITGKEYGRWKVLGFLGDGMWLCRCVCGTEKPVDGQSMKSGRSTGCYCQHGKGKITHGLSRSEDKPYKVWWDMIARCEDKEHESYHNYGGRGIVVCEEWHDVLQFYKDMGPRPGPEYSIDRVDNDGDYKPANCRWATRKEQQRNRRNNTFLTVRGERKTIAEWAEVMEVDRGLIIDRIRAGWDEEDAVLTPINTKPNKSRQS